MIIGTAGFWFPRSAWEPISNGIGGRSIGMHSHAERGNEGKYKLFQKLGVLGVLAVKRVTS